jgi:hypothetical protein
VFPLSGVKWEEVYLHQYRTFEEAQASLQMFLEDVCNAKRLDSSLDYVLPNEFELKYAMCSRLGGLDFLGHSNGSTLSKLLSRCEAFKVPGEQLPVSPIV